VTTTRPTAVRIDDLTDPRFPPEINDAFAAVEPVAAGLTLEPDALCEPR